MEEREVNWRGAWWWVIERSLVERLRHVCPFLGEGFFYERVKIDPPPLDFLVRRWFLSIKVFHIGVVRYCTVFVHGFHGLWKMFLTGVW